MTDTPQRPIPPKFALRMAAKPQPPPPAVMPAPIAQPAPTPVSPSASPAFVREPAPTMAPKVTVESSPAEKSSGWGWHIVIAILLAFVLGMVVYYGVNQRRAARDAEAILPRPAGIEALPPVETVLTDSRDPELMSYLGALQNAMVALAESQRLQTQQLAVMGSRLDVIDEVQTTTSALSTDLVALRAEMSGQIDLLRVELEQLRRSERPAVERDDFEPVAPVVAETPPDPEPVPPPVVEVADEVDIAETDEVEDPVSAGVDADPAPPAAQPSPTLLGPSSFSARASTTGSETPAFSPVMTSLVREDRPVYSPADVRLQPVDKVGD